MLSRASSLGKEKSTSLEHTLDMEGAKEHATFWVCLQKRKKEKNL
jgi:hypothetical protein